MQGQQDSGATVATAGSATPLRIIAAILLPPLGVFLARGLTPAFWLTVVLTLFAWLPGVLLALVLLLAPDLIPIR